MTRPLWHLTGASVECPNSSIHAPRRAHRVLRGTGGLTLTIPSTHPTPSPVASSSLAILTIPAHRIRRGTIDILHQPARGRRAGGLVKLADPSKETGHRWAGLRDTSVAGVFGSAPSDPECLFCFYQVPVAPSVRAFQSHHRGHRCRRCF